MKVLVLGVTEYVRKDGTKAARVIVASTPRNPNTRGLATAELEADPEVVDQFKVLPGLYELAVEVSVASYASKAEARPVIVSARFEAAVVPERKEVKA